MDIFYVTVYNLSIAIMHHQGDHEKTDNKPIPLTNLPFLKELVAVFHHLKTKTLLAVSTIQYIFKKAKHAVQIFLNKLMPTRDEKERPKTRLKTRLFPYLMSTGYETEVVLFEKVVDHITPKCPRYTAIVFTPSRNILKINQSM